MLDSVNESDMLKCLCDEKSLRLFRAIHDDLPVTITGLDLTRKQYYSRIKMMVDANLVDRSNGRYALTSLGKILNGFLDFLHIALTKNYWKFIAIDSLTTANYPLPVEEQTRIITSIMEANDIAESPLSKKNIIGLSIKE
jgi:hypothetical protein